MSSTKVVVSEERMRVLTSKELDEISAGICPGCILGSGVVGLSFLFGVSGSALAVYLAEKSLLIAASSLAITVASGAWLLNK